VSLSLTMTARSGHLSFRYAFANRHGLAEWWMLNHCRWQSAAALPHSL
jgi:hypothetical protein